MFFTAKNAEGILFLVEQVSFRYMDLTAIDHIRSLCVYQQESYDVVF